MNEDLRQALMDYLGARYSEGPQGPLAAPANERELLGVLEVISQRKGRLHQDVQLSRRAFSRLEPVDTVSGVVAAGAGATLAELEAHVARQDLSLGPLTPRSFGLQLGDFLEGPLGGLRSALGGRLEPLALSLEALLPDGSRYRTHPSPRSAAGPDLKALLLGAGGRFGVLLSAQVRLLPRPTERRWLRVEASDPLLLTRALRRAVAAGCWVAQARLKGRSADLEVIGSGRGVARDLRTVAFEASAVGGTARDELAPPVRVPLEHEEELSWAELLQRLADGAALTLHRLSIESAVAERAEAMPAPRWSGDLAALTAELDGRGLLGGSL